MNRKQLIILIVLGVLIGGAGIVVSKRRASSWQAGEAGLGKKILKDFPLNDVAQFTVKNSSGEVHLAKVDESWRLKERWNYPANFAQVGDAIRKAWELKSVQSVKVGASQMGRLELIPPGQETNSGTLVSFQDKGGKELASLLLGKKYLRESRDSSPMGGGDFPVGRYVMDPANPNSVSVVNETFTEIEPKPEQWLDKEFLKVEKVKSISVVSTNATNSWKLSRETEAGDWVLADLAEGEEFDKNKAASLNYILSSPSFNDVVDPAAPASQTGMEAPVSAKIETFDGFAYDIKVGAPSGEDAYYFHAAVNAEIPKERTAPADEKAEDKEKLDKEFKEKAQKLEEKLKKEKEFGNWTYLVSKWTVDSLLKPRKDFMAEKKTEANPAEGAGFPGSTPPAPPGLKIPGFDAESPVPIPEAPPQ